MDAGTVTRVNNVLMVSRRIFSRHASFVYSAAIHVVRGLLLLDWNQAEKADEMV